MESKQPVFSIQDISKAYGHIQALSNVSMQVNSGEIVGLVGENGAGKSTLLSILSGILEADEGKILFDGEEITFNSPREAADHGIALVHQEQDVITNYRGYENFFLGREIDRMGILKQEKMRKEAQEFVDNLGIELNVNEYVDSYSFHQRQMLEIAKAFYVTQKSDTPVIFLDEPTAGLEQEGRETLFRLMDDLQGRGSFVFVSHELDEVLEVTDRIYVLKDGEVVDEYYTDEATEDALQESMVGRETAEKYYQTSDQLAESELGEERLTVDDVQLNDKLGPISFKVRAGEIFGIVGVEGSGKERLGRLLAGDSKMTSGTITIGDSEFGPDRTIADMVNEGVGYIPKDRKGEGLLQYQSVLMNTSLAMVRYMNGALPFLDQDIEKTKTEKQIEELNIKTPGKNTLANDLSGGNQQKVVLGRWLARESPVLVMDNVTRGIDVGAKEEVYRICRELTNEGVSIVFIGDELPEVIGLSNRIGVMKGGEFVGEPVDAPKDAKPAEETLIQEMV